MLLFVTKCGCTTTFFEQPQSASKQILLLVVVRNQKCGYNHKKLQVLDCVMVQPQILRVLALGNGSAAMFVVSERRGDYENDDDDDDDNNDVR
jgi:hypothetical protein